jgi:hypothetical protein
MGGELIVPGTDAADSLRIPMQPRDGVLVARFSTANLPLSRNPSRLVVDTQLGVLPLQRARDDLVAPQRAVALPFIEHVVGDTLVRHILSYTKDGQLVVKQRRLGDPL